MVKSKHLWETATVSHKCLPGALHLAFISAICWGKNCMYLSFFAFFGLHYVLVCVRKTISPFANHTSSLFFFYYSLGPVGRRVIRVQFFFFFWGALLYFLSFFPFSFLYEEKKGSENSNKKNNQHFWCWGERKTPHPDKMLLFFFLALNKTKTMNPPFFF